MLHRLFDEPGEQVHILHEFLGILNDGLLLFLRVVRSRGGGSRARGLGCICFAFRRSGGRGLRGRRRSLSLSCGRALFLLGVCRFISAHVLGQRHRAGRHFGVRHGKPGLAQHLAKGGHLPVVGVVLLPSRLLHHADRFAEVRVVFRRVVQGGEDDLVEHLPQNRPHAPQPGARANLGTRQQPFQVLEQFPHSGKIARFNEDDLQGHLFEFSLYRVFLRSHIFSPSPHERSPISLRRWDQPQTRDRNILSFQEGAFQAQIRQPLPAHRPFFKELGSSRRNPRHPLPTAGPVPARSPPGWP